MAMTAKEKRRRAAARQQAWRERNPEEARAALVAWRRKNKDHVAERAKTNNKRIRQRNIDFIDAYKAEHPCIDCGEADPIVLEFDHMRGEKSFSISEGARRTRSLKSLRAELRKCDVRCIGCHRKRHRIENRRAMGNRAWVRAYLVAHPCVDCGEADPAVLEFDHVRGEKLFAIANGVERYGLVKLKAEILRCVVRCANCHRRRHHVERQTEKTVEAGL